MFGYARGDRCINQGGCGAGQAPVPADGDPGMPVVRIGLLWFGDRGGGDPAGGGARAGCGTSRSWCRRLTEPPPGLTVLLWLP